METRTSNHLLNHQRLKMFFLFVIGGFLFIQAGYAQIQIKGSVIDASGSPLIGVGISVKGSTTGTFSDVDGKYSISVPNEKATLRFSFLGFVSKEEVVGKRKEVNVTLQEDALNLDEVVVVGYGTQKKANLTGSVASIKGDEALTRNTVSLSSALVGTMPGVTVQQGSGQPGDDGASIRIRGIGSINAGSDPMVLVDGLEVSINQIDPSTIETITTLKDAASASIYGSRAANGVILITTKRGKEGPVKVSYRATASSQSPTNMPERVSSLDYMLYTNAAYGNIGSNKPYSQEKIDEYRFFRPDNWTRFDTDWEGEIIKNSALLQNHTVTLTGGSNTLKFVGVGNYIHQDGLIENNSYARYSLRMNTDAQINKWIKASVDANIISSKTIAPSINTPKSIINKALYMPGILAGINADGTWGDGKNGDNPIAAARVGGTSENNRPEMTLTGKLIINPIKDLEILGQYSRGEVTNRGRTFVRNWNYYIQGSQIGTAPVGNPSNLTESWNQNIRNLYIAQATYSKTIKDHSFKLLAGTQAEDNTYSNISVNNSGFEIPGREYFDNATGQTRPSGGKTDWSMVSLYSRFNYVYQNKYLLELNGRWDASSRFRDGLRWSLFPSFSAGWTFSEESFVKDLSDNFSFGKLRFSYGTLGNQSLGSNYPGWAQVNSGYSYWFGKQLNSGVAITTDSNPLLSWEKSTQLNIGLDLAFFNNRLSINGDFYIKDINDMIMTFPPPYFVGLKPAYTNAAKMRNTGWEVSVGYKNSINKFNYAATLIVDDARNKVLDLKGLTFQDNSVMVGYPNGGQWGYVTNGYFQNVEQTLDEPYFNQKKPGLGYVKYVDQNDDGYIDKNDQIYLGDPFPHFNYSLRLNADWKGIDCMIFIQGVGQRSNFMSGIGLQPFFNGSSLFTHQTDTWTKENRNAEYPILLPESNSADNFQKSDKWVRSGSYIRLKTVELGYTLPASLTKKLQVGSVRTFVGGQNLLTISNFYKGYDPEATVGGSNGGEFYPIMRLFTFGLDVKF